MSSPAARWFACAGALLLAACAAPPESKRPDLSKADTAASYNLQLGVTYLQQGNLQVAQEKLERAVRENPRDPNVYSALGMLEERLGDLRRADERYREALHMAPHDPNILNNYAVYLCRAGRVDEGVKRFEEVAANRLYRTPWAAWTNAGVCLLAVKRYAEAEKHLVRALELKADYAEAAVQLGELYFTTGRLEDCRVRVDRFLEKNRETPEMLWLGVRVARATGDRLGAERFARRLRVNFPEADQTRQLGDSGRGS